MAVTKNCAVCGSEFSVPKCRSESAHYCSIKCRSAANADRYKASRQLLYCLHCGVELKVAPSKVKLGEGKFCSKACHSASMVGVSTNLRSVDGDLSGAPGGYVNVRCENHPRNVKKYVLEHRFVIESELVKLQPDHHFLEDIDGVKCLRKDIHVHHKNEIKTDNRLENLVACTSAGHKCLHRGVPPMRGEVWPEPDCVEDHLPRRIESTCKKCGNSFSVKLSIWKLRGAKYCSNKCASGYEGDLPAKIEKACEECGKTFLAKRYRVLNGSGLYCSDECRMVALHKSRIKSFG